MHLHPEEPEATGWEPLDDDALVARVLALLPTGRGLVLVDGRSGSGKSTFATHLADLLATTAVHTDDVAWRQHPTDWAGFLEAGVLDPWRRGHPVSYRPPAWDAHDRPGSVEVPPARVLVVEGVGAGREALAAAGALVVWVQCDRDEARRRGIDRDVVLGRTREEAEDFWEEWMRSEEPFLAADRPWARAGLVVDGASAEGTTRVAPGPLRS